MGEDNIEQSDVLWIGTDLFHVPGLPNGFAFRVVDFLGPGGVDKRQVRLVWVRGALLDARGVPWRTVQLCVPVDQPRALPAPGARTGRHREDDTLLGPPQGFTRRAFR